MPTIESDAMKTPTTPRPDVRKHPRPLPPQHRRGSALVLGVALMFVLFSLLAFGIDTGFLAGARAEISRTADAAAMAGCWELYAQMENDVEIEDARPAIRSEAASLAALNPVCNQAPSVDNSPTTNEVSIGYVGSYGDAAISTDSTLPFYAVRVDINRNSNRNGEIPFFFGRIFGDTGRPMTANATAVMAKEISGFELPDGSSQTIDLLPFALDVDTWDDMINGVTTSDAYSYDAATGAVSNGSDGTTEVNLYPQGTGSPGNRGTVDIGGANNSTNDIARQIVHGISSQDLIDLGKPLQLDLSNGTMELGGDTGISAGVKDELASIVGETRVIPIFSSVSGNGNNAVYTIVRWVGVRILHVKLTGKMSGKQLIIQRAPVMSPYSIASTSGSNTSDFVLTPVRLAR